jgi:hypothetical protein
LSSTRWVRNAALPPGNICACSESIAIDSEQGWDFEEKSIRLNAQMDR